MLLSRLWNNGCVETARAEQDYVRQCKGRETSGRRIADEDVFGHLQRDIPAVGDATYGSDHRTPRSHDPNRTTQWLRTSSKTHYLQHLTALLSDLTN